ncbi:MAG: AAA domain-containing protein [Actinomycetia bacterium]|nr:AAA domain-containing protein [Actinomycetes bacterium]
MEIQMAEPTISPERYAEVVHAIESEVGKVIVGQRDVVRAVVVAMLCEGHVLLEGVPGLGKTMLLKALSDALTLEFGRIQFTPDLMPADVTGTQVLETDESGGRVFRFREGPVFAGLVLADEINRATPKTQSALLEAMQERAVTVAGATRALPRPFLVMATQNPIEQEGTYPLPEAQLDRFLFKIEVGFPSADELFEIVERTTAGHEATPNAVTTAEELASMIALTRRVPAASHVTRHAIDLVVATHPQGEGAPGQIQRYVRNGASPRGAQALILGAKATALLDGRPSASVDDVRAVAKDSLGHRLVLGFEAVADAVAPSALVDAVLEAVPVPPSGVRGAP